MSGLGNANPFFKSTPDFNSKYLIHRVDRQNPHGQVVWQNTILPRLLHIWDFSVRTCGRWSKHINQTPEFPPGYLFKLIDRSSKGQYFRKCDDQQVKGIDAAQDRPHPLGRRRAEISDDTARDQLRPLMMKHAGGVGAVRSWLRSTPLPFLVQSEGFC